MAVRRRRRDLAAALAVLVGLGLGLGLLANLGPARIADPSSTLPSVVAAVRSPAGSPAGSPEAPVAVPPPDVLARRPSPHGLPASEVALPDTGAPSTHATLLVDVVDADGRTTTGALAAPIDCPGFQPTPEAGRYIADPGACVLRAMRRDGLLYAWGTPSEIVLKAGDVAYLQLELATAPTGGVGVRFQPTPRGMQVVHVIPGSPAWDAGLESGDLIVDVNGILADGLPVEAFVEAMTGPVGTDVEFTVELREDGGADFETVRVTRRFLDG